MYLFHLEVIQLELRAKGPSGYLKQIAAKGLSHDVVFTNQAFDRAAVGGRIDFRFFDFGWIS
jgi:hypothetical protein